MGKSKTAIKLPPVEQLRGRPLGRILMKMGILSREKVHECLTIQKQRGGGVRIGEIFLELGLIDETQLQVALAAKRGMEYVNIDGLDVPQEVIDKVPAQTATSYHIVPIEYNKAKNELVVVLDNVDNFRATDDLRTLMGFSVTAKMTDRDALEAALKKYYESEDDNITELIDEIQSDAFLAEFDGRNQSIDLDELKELSESNPVKKLLNLVLLQAIRDKASDIHFEPFETEYKMRYRIDGVLYEMIPPPKYIAAALSSRIKVMANLDIAERRLPQDGRISLSVQGNPIDLRVSVLPTMFGESVVLRVLDRSQVSFDLEKLGFQPEDLKLVRQLINRPNGIIIVTGPTGSGKTTTLYSALSELNTIDSKIITTEDPVEYDLDGLIQVQMKPDIGLTFARCLRSILRQDPDIVLVGEIRDHETAEIAAQASLTGHLVFTTLHTNDAPSSVARLLDLGVEPFLITATIEGVVAQRLVRRICTKCKTPYEPDEAQLKELSLTEEEIAGRKFYYGKGCSKCNGTGYKGRTGVYEIMIFNDEIRDLIMNRASTNVLRVAAQKAGMRPLRYNGLIAVFDGITTIDEIAKETITES
ncbi:MAG: type II secretion system ATPase GspE [Sedimentisphaerales bacterium]|jgi:type IV pilus assembly protein PilB|nr:type II secretion system ATPase GspE [Sedimentisphaerales bacterium]NLZ04997.1 type II secretion system ATPase GspE [Phycisphaerae bacterium]HNY77930.1 type II secretion system ATPase GspE [Sedimentisphaerales bacterium]HOC63326.1 type II secretion system ATPase GspE [Sedimentisphaerales bacterium]HOH64144.1 type II secretion system ATPase GspE [Sedimentisphaerales bacterium]